MRHNGPPGKGELPQIDPAAIEVRDRLSRRARERSAAQRWNGYTLILTYAILATITIMAVESVGTLQLAGVAILGLKPAETPDLGFRPVSGREDRGAVAQGRIARLCGTALRSGR
jgi:hypothetical protein